MIGELTNNNGDDASSNPNAEEHLPTAGEFRTTHVPEDGTITDVDDEEDIKDPNNMDEISSKSTDSIPGALDPDELADPLATGDKSY